MRAWWMIAALLPSAALACKCAGEGSVCSSLAASEVAFIGTVESIDPAVNPWDPAVAARLEKLVPEAMLADKSAAGLTRVKRAYLQGLPNLPERFKRELERVASWKEFDEFWERVREEGARARFQVQQGFRGTTQASMDVWSDFSDCGIVFEKGETYLVYASASKKKGGRLETSICARTKRVTDAGDDLAYLYFVRRGGSAASRFYGFVTTLEDDLRTPPPVESVAKPVGGLIVKIESASGARTADTDSRGKFVVDGLEAGEYRLSVFADLRDELPLATPQKVQIAANTCSSRVVLVRTRGEPK